MRQQHLQSFLRHKPCRRRQHGPTALQLALMHPRDAALAFENSAWASSVRRDRNACRTAVDGVHTIKPINRLAVRSLGVKY